VSYSTSWQYDDNVLTLPDDAALGASNDHTDWRTVHLLQTQYQHTPEDGLGFKGGYDFYYAKQDELGFFNMMIHDLNLEPVFRFDKSTLSFPTTFSHTSVDRRSYLVSPSTGVQYNLAVGQDQMGQAFLKYKYNQFLWTAATSDEDRDGPQLDTGFGWFWFFAKQKGYVNARYGFSNDWTKGQNWDHHENRLDALLLVPLHDKLDFSIATGVNFQDFDNTHTIFAVKRNDTQWSASTLISYSLTKWAEVQAQYTFIRNESNIGVYDYKRRISSIGITIKF